MRFSFGLVWIEADVVSPHSWCGFWVLGVILSLGQVQ